MINTLCEPAARYLIYHENNRTIHGTGVESLGSTVAGCLQPSVEYLGVLAIHGQSHMDIGHCPFDESGSTLIAAVEHEIASLALFPTTMRPPAEGNVPRPRAGPRRQPGTRSTKKAFSWGVAPDSNVGHTQIGIDQGPLPDPACWRYIREITLSLGDIWELSVPPKEDL